LIRVLNEQSGTDGKQALDQLRRDGRYLRDVY
jgi:sulfite reductase alpha subunit-like flavoprotein